MKHLIKAYKNNVGLIINLTINYYLIKRIITALLL